MIPIFLMNCKENMGSLCSIEGADTSEDKKQFIMKVTDTVIEIDKLLVKFNGGVKPAEAEKKAGKAEEKPVEKAVEKKAEAVKEVKKEEAKPVEKAVAPKVEKKAEPIKKGEKTVKKEVDKEVKAEKAKALPAVVKKDLKLIRRM